MKLIPELAMIFPYQVLFQKFNLRQLISVRILKNAYYSTIDWRINLKQRTFSTDIPLDSLLPQVWLIIEYFSNYFIFLQAVCVKVIQAEHIDFPDFLNALRGFWSNKRNAMLTRLICAQIVYIEYVNWNTEYFFLSSIHHTQRALSLNKTVE